MLPNGRTLTTLEDERGGPTMFARNGFRRLECPSVIDRLHVQLDHN
jgi:hypothetical protein